MYLSNKSEEVLRLFGLNLFSAIDQPPHRYTIVSISITAECNWV